MASPLAAKATIGGWGLRPFYVFGSGSALPPQKIICYWIFKVAQRYHFGDFSHENLNIFGKIFYEYFGKNLRIFMWKIAEIIVLSDFTNPVTYYLLRRKGRATSKSVEGAQPPPPNSGFNR